jgi:hypothetical protein
MMTSNTVFPDQNDVAILVVSCDAYQDLWKPFFHCFFKYWPDCPFSVHLGSNFATYDDSRVIPIPIGADIDYSSNLLKMLEQIEQEWVILWIEDRPPRRPVRTNDMLRMINTTKEKGAVYLKLIPNLPRALGNEEIGEIPKGTRYRVCMTVVLWRKAILQEFLQPGESAWQIEYNGGRRADLLDDKFLALGIRVTDPPLQDIHLVAKRRIIREAIPFLQTEGILHHLESRSPVSLRFHIYAKLNLLFWNLVYSFRRLKHGLGV